MHAYEEYYSEKSDSWFATVKNKGVGRYSYMRKDYLENRSTIILMKVGFMRDLSGRNFGVLPKLIPEGKMAMFMDLHKLPNYEACRIAEYRPVTVNPDVVHSIVYDDKNNQWYGRHVWFEWKKYSYDELSDVNKKDLFACKRNPLIPRTLRAGARNNVGLDGNILVENSQLLETETISYSQPLIHIPEQFKEMKTGTCVWASAALAIYQKSPQTAMRMVEMAKASPDEFSWMSFKKEIDEGPLAGNNLHTCLQKVGYQSRKIKGVKRQNLLQYILNEGIGVFVCILLDENGAESHAVAIYKQSSDQRNGILLDSIEKYALQLNMTNLNMICGKFSSCIGIGRAIMIEEQKKRKKENASW